MKGLYKLRDMLCDELEKFGENGELSAGALETVDKLAHAIKNIDKVLEGEEGYSMGGDWMAGGRYGHSYDSGQSYRRRDNMGRYPRDGYSRGRESMVERMRRMMMEAGNERERDAINRAIQMMEMS